MNQPVKIPKLLWLILILFLFISIVTTFVALRNPGGRSYPLITNIGPKGDKGDSPQIDYEKISSIISQEVSKQVATIPKAQVGKPGQTITGPIGPSGINGVNGTNGESIKGDTGAQGIAGDTVPAREIELRHNDAKALTEWHYVGSLNWSTLVLDCTLLNNCVAP